MSYGPQLPPHLLKIREASQSNVEKEKSDDEKEEIVTYGPAIPANNKLKNDENHETKSESIGPQLPPNFRKTENTDKSNKSLSDSDSDEEFVGPLPSYGDCNKKSRRQEQIEIDLENRARKIKNSQAIKDTVEEAPKRESWMLELPAEKAKNFGLGPRQFSKNTESKPKLDRSWTDTPETKAKRAALAASGQLHQEEDQTGSKEDQDVLEYMASLKRDQEMEAVANELRQKKRYRFIS